MGYCTGKALIRRRTGQPAVNIVSEYKSFRRQSDGSMLPDSIKLTAETENVSEPTYEWFVIGANESGGRKWVKIENSNSNTYNVSPPELNADGEEAWTKKTFKVTVSDILQAVIVSDTIIIEVEEPVEVGGVNLLTRDNWEQGALNKQAKIDSAYDKLKTSSTKVLRVINLVSVGYNHVYSIGNTDYEYAYINFIGSREGGPVYKGPAYYSEWKDKNSYVRRPRAGNNYVAVMLRKKNGGDITIDDFEKSRLKLENGTVDTDWSPSPSDSWIKYDPATDALYVEKSFYSLGGISALGLGEGGGSSGGGGVDMLDSWTNYTEAKANYYVPSSLLVSFRSNTIAQITGLEDALDAKQDTLIAGANITISDNTISASGGMSSVAWGDITDKPTTFEPSTHTHPTTDITDLGNIATINKNNSTDNYLRGDGTWVTPPNTTYSTGTLAQLEAGSDNTGRLQTAKNLNDWLNDKGYITSYIDTNSITGITAGASGTITNSTASNPYIKVRDDSTHRSEIRLSGSGATTVKSDASGNITIVYTHPTTDGNKHVPATGTANSGKVLKAGATAGSISWGTLSHSDVGAASSDHTHSNMVTTNTAQTITGAKTFTKGVKIGAHATDGLIEWDATNNAFKFNGSVYATGGISALGLGEGGGSSGGGGVDMLDAWANYTTAKANYYVPSSLLVSFRDYTLDKLNAIEGGSASAIATTGTGNAITSVSKVENTLTFEKGSTFALSSHTHSNITITAGNGLSGGGALSENRTLTVKYGTAAGTAAQGNDSRINNGQTAHGWGNHASAGYIKSYVDTKYTAGANVQISGTNVISATDTIVDISGKVDKITGKGLSTNDYTSAEKVKLNGIEEGATNLSLGTSSTTAYRGDRGNAAYTHISDAVKHITAAERTSWNNKSNLALGTSSTTAYRGDRGNAAYTHITDTTKHITAGERTSWNAKATPADITTAIDGIEIGGRNLITDSTNINILPLYGATATYNSVANSSVPSGVVFTATNITRTNGNFVFFLPILGSSRSRFKVANGERVTVSFYIKTNVTQMLQASGFNLYTEVNATWKKVQHNFIFSESGNLHYSLIGAGLTSFEVHSIKMERGTKATDWTSAPEDTDRKLGYMKARYIRDYLNGSSVDSYNYWVQIKALNKAGANIALNKTVTSNITTVNLARITNGDMDVANYARTSGGNQYVQIDLGQVYYDIDNIIVHHYWAGGRTFYNTKTQISEDGTTWKTIFDSAVEGTYVETNGGKVHAHKGIDDKLNLTGGTLTGILTASAGVNTPKVDFGNGFTIEPSGTELVFKYNGVIRQRMLSNGTILATGGITALTT